MVVWWNKECALFPLGIWGQIDALLSWFINTCGLWSEVESQKLNEFAPNQEQVLKPRPTRNDYLEKHLQQIALL